LTKISEYEGKKSPKINILNLFSNDGMRIYNSTYYAAYFVVAPLTIISSATILTIQTSYASLYGLILLVLVVPFQLALNTQLTKLKYLFYPSQIFKTDKYFLFLDKTRKKRAEETDKRITLTSNTLSGIKVIKMNCWETYFEHLIQAVRK
jgi:hypothetical protein